MSNRKILVVEDDPGLAQAIEEAGSQFNLQADRATDGWDAIEKLEENDYSLIVVDLEVPQSSGYGVVTFLRQEYGHALDRLILMTGHDQHSVEAKVHECRCRIISRTDSVDQLAEAMREIV